jgi:hypothetical protein
MSVMRKFAPRAADFPQTHDGFHAKLMNAFLLDPNGVALSPTNKTRLVRLAAASHRNL